MDPVLNWISYFSFHSFISSLEQVVNEWDLDGSRECGRPRLLSTLHHSDGDVLALAAGVGTIHSLSLICADLLSRVFRSKDRLQ